LSGRQLTIKKIGEEKRKLRRTIGKLKKWSQRYS